MNDTTAPPTPRITIRRLAPLLALTLVVFAIGVTVGLALGLDRDATPEKVENCVKIRSQLGPAQQYPRDDYSGLVDFCAEMHRDGKLGESGSLTTDP